MPEKIEKTWELISPRGWYVTLSAVYMDTSTGMVGGPEGVVKKIDIDDRRYRPTPQ